MAIAINYFVFAQDFFLYKIVILRRSQRIRSRINNYKNNLLGKRSFRLRVVSPTASSLMSWVS